MFRTSGILLHPTSLPGKFGIGDLGVEAYRFVDFLRNSGQHLWQMLPVGPTGYNNSPYQCHSAFAGNPLLISLEKIAEEGLLDQADFKNAPAFPEYSIDFVSVYKFKSRLLQKAYTSFETDATLQQKEAFDTFCLQNTDWLPTYASYMAFKEINNLKAWYTWETGIRKYQHSLLREWRGKFEAQISFQEFQQYMFFKQWTNLKSYCHQNDVLLIGDLPIFMALDSTEVWSRPDMFYLDETGLPTIVAGVPPDYFSKTGQLWGNPVYRWDVMKSENYAWWIERLETIFRLFDKVRIDHFRGFEKYWAIPAGDKTAERGYWLPGPGRELFETIITKLGNVPIIAEDLGVITPEVEELRDHFGYPGMRVLQFAFSGDTKQNVHMPHLFKQNCIVYTGTHDNTPVLGWFRGEDLGETMQNVDERRKEANMALKYLGTNGKEINWDFIRLAFESIADTAIIPLQDVIGLGNAARMNTPGTVEGNWIWRYSDNMITENMEERLKEITYLSGR
jgi:4-alpha-glucanotransferase